MVLDLNGHTLTLTGDKDFIISAGVMEISDNSGTGLGTLNLNNNTGGIVVEYGYLQLNSGTINGDIHLPSVSDHGTPMFIMFGGTVNGNILKAEVANFTRAGGTHNGEVIEQ